MNTEPSDLSPSLPDELCPPILGPRSHPLIRWLKCLLAGNPFYLASAALLLYGLSHVSNGTRLAHEEENQLLFNLGSLGVYEVMLVGTVLLLVARTIWYDAALLVWLENLFIFVPFILISQASLIGGDLVWATCLSASVLVVGKLALLRWRVKPLNYPPALLIIGTLLLLANLLLALRYRALIEDDPFAWKAISGGVWLVVLPALQLLVCMLPRASRWGGFGLHQSAVPFVATTVWVAATATHVAAVDYVDDLAFRPASLAPLVWVLGWMLYRRLHDFLPEPSRELRNFMVALPMAALLLTPQDPKLCFMLSAMSAMIYTVICLREWEITVAQVMAVVSAALALFTVPARFLSMLSFTRPDWIVMLLAVPAFVGILLSRNPRLGIAGGFGLVIALTKLNVFHSDPTFMTVQCATVFVLLHSLRWNDAKENGAKIVRAILCLIWLAHTMLAGTNLALPAEAQMSLLAWLVFAVVGGLRVLTGRWPAPVLWVTALAVLLTNPALDIKRQLGPISSDLLTVAGSFALFGLGTLLALTKHRWLHREPGDSASS